MQLASSGGRRLSAAALEGRQYKTPHPAISRKELSAAGRDAMKGLKLRPALRAVLGELIGCWGETVVNDKILVWPSNEYLCRTTGLCERTVRYGIRGLVEARLITPKDSANGKRFAIKNRAGSLVDVYGFDLTPVYSRRLEWVELIRAQDIERESRARLFDEVTICSRAVESVLLGLPVSEECTQISDRLEELRLETPRRNLTCPKERLVPIVERWRALRGVAEETFYNAASGGKSCRPIESKPPNFKIEYLEQEAFEEGVRAEDPSTRSSNVPVELVVEACPSLSDFVEVPRTEVDLVAAGRYLRGSLGAHATVWDEAVKLLGPINAAATVCLVLQLHSDDPRIRNPGGYLRAMVRMLSEGRTTIRYELMAAIRKREKPS